MAISTMDLLIASFSAARKQTMFKASATAEGAGTYHSLLKVVGSLPVAANPPTGSGGIPTSADTYTLPLTNAGVGKTQYLARADACGSQSGTLILYDRLWHNSGLDGTLTTVQTVNSAALTRYTDGVGVELFLEVYTALGATASTFTALYTDSETTAESAAYAQPANALTVGQLVPFQLGDNAGVKSIQSVQLSVSTGTAGNFGLVLLKRIAEIPLQTAGSNMDAFQLAMPTIADNAALCSMVYCSTTSTGAINASFDFVEG